MSKNRKKPRGTLVFLTCLLAVPTVSHLLYGIPGKLDAEAILPYLLPGVLLGIAHLILRPLLRLITAPLGCLTFGLSGMVIDVGLIYLCAHFIADFHVPSPAYALITALFINTIAAIVGGRK